MTKQMQQAAIDVGSIAPRPRDPKTLTSAYLYYLTVTVSQDNRGVYSKSDKESVFNKSLGIDARNQCREMWNVPVWSLITHHQPSHKKERDLI